MNDPPGKFSLANAAFSLQDFFGMLVPGGCLLLCAFLFESNFTGTSPLGDAESLPVHRLFHVVKPVLANATSTAPAQAAFWAICVLVTYVTGHVVAVVANFVLDRVVVFKGYGYPYESILLGPSTAEAAPRMFYRGSFFWLNFWLVMWLGIRIFYLSAFAWMHWATFIGFILFVVGIKSLAREIIKYKRIVVVGTEQPQGSSESMRSRWKAGVERLFRRGMICARRHVGVRNILNWLRKRWRIALLMYAFPHDWLAAQVQNYTRTHEPLEGELVARYKVFFQTRFGFAADCAKSDNFWFSLFYVYQRDDKIAALITRYFRVSNFARNMSTALFLCYAYGVFSLFLCDKWISVDYRWPLFKIVAFLLFLAVIFGVSFYYIFVAYYSKCLYRAFVYLNVLEQSQSGRELGNDRKTGELGQIGAE